MLIGGVVNNQLGDDLDILFMGRIQKLLELPDVTISGIDTVVISNIVPVIPLGRGVKWQQPYGGNSQVLEIIQLFHETFKVANAIPVSVTKGLNMGFINDGIFIPVQFVVKL